MQCFAPATREIRIAAGAPGEEWDLKLLPIEEIRVNGLLATTSSPSAVTASPAGSAPAPSELQAETSRREDPVLNQSADPDQDGMDNILINGRENNSASSPFPQSAAFGNARNVHRLYNGMLGLTINNSALDARPFSLTGQTTAKQAYNQTRGIAAFGGPLRIPRLVDNGPIIFVSYQWTRNNNALSETGLMPSPAERNGDFSALPTSIFDPSAGLPFSGNVIPRERLSQPALALLNLYPLPNFAGSSSYNYQVSRLAATHQDGLQVRISKLLTPRNQLSGSVSYQSARQSTPNLFDFLDATESSGLNSGITWLNTIRPRLYGTLRLQFSRSATTVKPYFQNRLNVAGAAGIVGNNQDSINWGPPSLMFADGISSLSDAEASLIENQTAALGYSVYWSKRKHNITLGADLRQQEFNYLWQQNPRGSLGFTGVAAGEAFADFLIGVPDTSSLAFGNADKYFRTTSYDAFVTDDWRIRPDLTVNIGMRWEYNAPITELYGRLVNLDISKDFDAVAPVVARDPYGLLTGVRYPDSLVHPDKRAVQPRASIAWRPSSGSSLVIRSGYGVYYNTSVYQSIALQMAQQSPLSTSLSVQNSTADPLTLAHPFTVSPAITPDLFAVDPRFRVGYAQNWDLSIQRDLPGGLGIVATYLGIKGTRAVQEFLPNTYPTGATIPCSSCPAGFVYMTSNGDSTFESGRFQLRRRLHAGLAASLQYSFSKSIDDASLGGGVSGSSGQARSSIAQNWLNLSGERGLSPFDQRNLLRVQVQYRTGMGQRGGTLPGGWRGALFKEWQMYAQSTFGSGLPLTPTYFSPVQGTGFTGSLRPDVTGASIYAAPPGLFLNPAAYTAPIPAHWGDAGRDSIIGPRQFSLNISAGRTFRFNDRLNLDVRVDSTNSLNHVNFPSWVTTVNSAQFGLPVAANPMRSLQTTFRFRF
jgi:hypothetical protein